jgi:hypothetical protein
MSLKLSTKEKTVVSKTKVATIAVKGDSAAAFYAVVDLAAKQVAIDPASVPNAVTEFLSQVDAGRNPEEFPKAP